MYPRRTSLSLLVILLFSSSLLFIGIIAKDEDDPYKILRVSSKADEETITKAYQQLAGEHTRIWGTKEDDYTQKLANAYDLLMNKEKRAKLDQQFLDDIDEHFKNEFKEYSDFIQWDERQRAVNKKSVCKSDECNHDPCRYWWRR